MSKPCVVKLSQSRDPVLVVVTRGAGKGGSSDAEKLFAEPRAGLRLCGYVGVGSCCKCGGRFCGVGELYCCEPTPEKGRERGENVEAGEV